MKNVNFKTHFNSDKYPKKPEIGSGERRVETAGFIDLQTRVENMLNAGQRLIQSRKEMYDFDGEVDEDFHDPTREYDFDMADASQIAISLEAKAKALKANQEAQKKAVEADKKGGEDSPLPKGDKTPPEGQ